MFSHKPDNYVRRVPDLMRDPALVMLNRAYPLIVLGGILLPGLIALALMHTWSAFFTATLWAGLVRIFFVHHTTWSINSICHLFGSRPYATNDESRNNALCAWLTFGEGWHNNHHAFPTSASIGLRWWQADVGFWLIRLLSMFGLAWDVRQPNAEQIADHGSSSPTTEADLA
jgi:stearoyl-CoA desaturase (delta-9 desaturase)